MKKLLVLALVLSITSFAGAALQITGAPTAEILVDEVMTLGMSTDAAIQYQGGSYFALVATEGILSVDNMTGIAVGASTGTNAGNPDSGLTTIQGVTVPFDTGWIMNVTGVQGLTGGAFAMDGSGGILAGTQLFNGFEIKGAAVGEGMVYLLVSPDLSDGSWTTAASFAVVVTPEPMTMGLLALGGLFIRRRK